MPTDRGPKAVGDAEVNGFWVHQLRLWSLLRTHRYFFCLGPFVFCTSSAGVNFYRQDICYRLQVYLGWSESKRRTSFRRPSPSI